MSSKAFCRREAERCGAELRAIQSAGRATSRAGALSWSVAGVVWGNGAVVAGRQFGHDQWITLSGVPLFGLAGWWWLARRGFPRHAIGLQLPRRDGNRVLSLVTLAAAGFSGACAVAGLATFTHERRGLRTIRTIIGTAFGEELVHRGILLTVWASTGVPGWVVFAANVAVFGAWHVVGAGCGRFNPWEVIGPAVLAVPLVWVRLRTHSIVAPTTLHAATNLPGVLQAPKAGCRW